MKTFNKAMDLPNLLYEALPTIVFDLSSISLRELLYMVKTVTNVILPSTPDLLSEKWVLLRAFVPVN